MRRHCAWSVSRFDFLLLQVDREGDVGNPAVASAVRQARSATFSTWVGPMMRSLKTATSMNSLSSSTSCCVSVPIRSWN